MIRPSKRINRSFWCGFFVYGCFSALIQDWNGKEWYMKQVSEHWVDIHWFVWLPIISVLLIVHAVNQHTADKDYRPRYDGGV